MASYIDSELYKLAKRMAVEIHQMTLDGLPKFEMYEQGSQIRRASKSIVANFVEGYGRRRYQAEYVKFLTYALASCDETGSLPREKFDYFYSGYRKIGAMIYNLRQAVLTGKAT
jgi:four helix bundle protein